MAKVCNQPVCVKRFAHNEDKQCHIGCKIPNIQRSVLYDEHHHLDFENRHPTQAFCIPYQLWKRKMKPDVHYILGDHTHEEIFDRCEEQRISPDETEFLPRNIIDRLRTYTAETQPHTESIPDEDAELIYDTLDEYLDEDDEPQF